MDVRAEWLKNRKLGIGSSDAPAVHNKSPYMTALELYYDKTSDEQEENTNYAMERGNQLEPIARKLFAAEFNIENGADEVFEPANVVCESLPILRASLDGRSQCKSFICEIKFQGLEAHNSGIIRENYWIQIQHQLLVSGALQCFFVSYNPKADVPVRTKIVYPDKEFFADHIDSCVNFWNCVQLKQPPEPSDKDFKTLMVKGAKAKAKRWVYLKQKIDEMTEEIETLREEILGMVDHPKMKILNIRIQQQTRAGSVDYKQIPQLKDVDLEPYRKAPSVFYKMDIEE